MCVTQCYIGVLDTYANPRTLTFPDLYTVGVDFMEVFFYAFFITLPILQVDVFKLIDCDKAHYPREIIQ